MTPTFKIAASECIHITDTWISNGHWAVSTSENAMGKAPKILRNLVGLKSGTYGDGVKYGRTKDAPRLENILPSKDGYQRISETAVKACFSELGDKDEISSYEFVTLPQTGEVETKVFIDPKYVPLMRLGTGWAKPNSKGDYTTNPVRVTVDDELIAVIMPRRN